MRFISLSSGSSGNCYYVESKEAKILIDAGVSARYIKNSLKTLDIKVEEIDAIFVTHEHSDHICGAEVLSRNCKIPVYSNQLTIKSILDNKVIKQKDLFRVFDSEINIKNLNIISYSLNHDAVCPIGYIIDDSKTRLSVLTDTGCVTEDIYKSIKGSKTVLLESNHDLEMLMKGPYHYSLKKRIMSNVGHLSNDAAGRTAVRLIGHGTTNIILGHISSTNNDYDKVLQSIYYYLSVNNIKLNEDVSINIAKKFEISKVHFF